MALLSSFRRALASPAAGVRALLPRHGGPGALLGLLLGLGRPQPARAQGKYLSRAGHISFFSVSIMKDIP